MKTKYISSLALLLLVFAISISSCKKFLDEKPNKKLVIPATLADLWAIMDYTNVMVINDPYVDEISTDNFYLTPSVINVIPETDANLYLWKSANLYVAGVNSWSALYSKVYYANTVLEQIEKIDRTALNEIEWDNVKGHAYMVRGKAFLQALNIWSKAYDQSTSATDLGIPLRLTTDFELPTTRASVEASYQQAIADLKAAAALLGQYSLSPIRATKTAAFGFLARAYLAKREYENVRRYADSALMLYSTLLDYNVLNANATFPIPRLNKEIISYTSFSNTALTVSNARIDSTLYNSYSPNDRRKKVFFRLNSDGTYGFKGTYVSATGHYAGMATDELFLMRSEALARMGEKDAALLDLNTLAKNRYDANNFVPFAAGTSEQVLSIVLAERRKELIFRGLRWMDIKRLNKEGAGIVLRRKLNGTEYTLSPNDNRYALPIPEYVIQIAHIPQNP